MGLVTFIVAFCSIVYELLLSETASILLGGTFYRYITTIGLYIFCLGLGSITFSRLKKLNLKSTLLYVELLLSLIGGIIVLLPLAFEGWLLSYDIVSSQSYLSAVVYIVVAVVGLLSGIELPLLMALSEQSEKGSQVRILAIDFFATFLGIITFPVLMLPTLGVFNMAIFVSCLNMLMAWYLFFVSVDKKAKLPIFLISNVLYFGFVYLNAFHAQYFIQRVFP